MKYKELTEKIIGCAYRVYNRMGCGFKVLIINFGERKARPPCLSSQPACHARHERAGGGQVEITCSAQALLLRQAHAWRVRRVNAK